jgi:hypothetical protein
MSQLYLALTWLVPSPLMGESQGGGEIISRLYCIIPPLPPGEGLFKALDVWKLCVGRDPNRAGLALQ